MTYLVIGIAGLLIGSFLHVVAIRTLDHRPWWRGRSVCDTCSHVLTFRDLIPVFSFLIQKGRCHYCSTRLSISYPLVELATAGLFLFVALVHGTPNSPGVIPADLLPLLIRDWAFISILILLFLTDLKGMLLPDVITLPAIGLALLLQIWIQPEALGTIMLGGAVIGGWFAAQYLLSHGRWVGGGDIRLGVLMGVMLGLLPGLLALFLAYVLGAMIAVWLLASGRADRKTPVPFGAFLTVATTITLLYGTDILDWYLGLFTFV